MERYLKTEALKGEFSGNVYVSKNGKVLLDKSYGYANKEFEVKNNRETKFNLGSINKVFTAVAIAQLLEAGKLSLDEPVSKYIPDFKHKRAGDVTVRHLLEHKSGFGFYWDNEKFLNNRTDLKSIDDYISFIQEEELQFEPGTKKSYSNSGYEILGYIVQTVSGIDYYEYIQNNIYKIADMPDTRAYERDVIVKNRAVAYTKHLNGGGKTEKFSQIAEHYLSIKGTAAGGGYSTINDMRNFIRAVLSGRLVSLEYLKKVRPSFAEKGKDFRMAGGAPGINAFISGNSSGDYLVIVLTNYDPPVAMKAGKTLTRLLK